MTPADGQIDPEMPGDDVEIRDEVREAEETSGGERSEQAKDAVSGRTEDWLSGNAEQLNQRPADGPAGPLSEQSAGEATDISTDPMPPSGA